MSVGLESAELMPLGDIIHMSQSLSGIGGSRVMMREIGRECCHVSECESDGGKRTAVKRGKAGGGTEWPLILETFPCCTSPFHPCLTGQVLLTSSPLKSGQCTDVLWSLSEETGQSVRAQM